MIKMMLGENFFFVEFLKQEKVGQWYLWSLKDGVQMRKFDCGEKNARIILGTVVQQELKQGLNVKQEDLLKRYDSVEYLKLIKVMLKQSH